MLTIIYLNAVYIQDIIKINVWQLPPNHAITSLIAEKSIRNKILLQNYSSEVDIEKIENIRVQVQNISMNSERKFRRAMVLGNDVILYYGGIDDRIVYSLNVDGKLTLFETK